MLPSFYLEELRKLARQKITVFLMLIKTNSMLPRYENATGVEKQKLIK